MNLEQKLLDSLSSQFPGHHFAPESLELKHRGRFANALVFRYRDDKLDLTIKDFTHCPGPIRATFGRYCISKEHTAMSRLQGIPGITPAVRRLSSYAVAYTFIRGQTLYAYNKTDRALPVAFFQQMEETVLAMHARGIAHLDLRNMANILCGEDGRPYLIDFQSALQLRRVPRFLHGFLTGADLSAVCKAWDRYCATPLPPDKRAFFDEFNRIRKFWVLKGYPFRRLWAKLRRK